MVHNFQSYLVDYFLPGILVLGPFLYLFLNQYLLVEDATGPGSHSNPPAASSELNADKSKPKNADPGINPSSLFGSNSNETKKPLPPPLDKPYTPQELANYDGSDKDLPVLLAVKGKIFDVSGNRITYSPGGGYHMFSGKDASRALGISSLKKADCTDDLTGMTEQQLKVLDDWYSFF